VQQELKAAGADVKWVEPKNIHLTLKFLGEISDKQLEQISGVIEAAAKNYAPFPANIASLGAFPRVESARVIWAGIDKGDAQIKSIAEVIEKSCEKLGFAPEDREFSSHITLGRTKSSLNRKELVESLSRLKDSRENKDLEFNVEKITLFKSTLTPKGAVYEALKEASLINT
jgi:2'-5' RNA ligase